MAARQHVVHVLLIVVVALVGASAQVDPPFDHQTQCVTRSLTKKRRVHTLTPHHHPPQALHVTLSPRATSSISGHHALLLP